MQIDSAGPEDLPGLRALLSGAGLPTDGIDSLVDEFLVVRGGTEGLTLLAAGAVERTGDTGLLRSLVVRDDRRGSGLGRRVTNALIARSRRNGLAALYLLTETAEPFFAGLGFDTIRRNDAPESIRRTEEYRVLCPDSATLMRLTLASPAARPS